MRDENVGRHRQQRDGREILDRIERQFGVEAGADAEIGDVAQHDGVAVGQRARDDFGADVAVAAGAVVDHHLLAQRFGQALRERARERVGAAAGGERHDEAHRPYWIGNFRRGGGCCAEQRQRKR